MRSVHLRGLGVVVVGLPAARSTPTPSVEAQPYQRRNKLAARVRMSWLEILNPVARVPRVLRSVEWRRTERGARAAQRGLGVVVLWASVRRAPSPRRRSRLNRTNTATHRRQGAQTFLGSACVSRGARPARVSHHGVAADRPRSTRRAERAWRGCGAGQHAASSSPRRRSRRDRTNTATSRRQKIRSVLASAFGSHGARPARVSHH